MGTAALHWRHTGVSSDFSDTTRGTVASSATQRQDNRLSASSRQHGGVLAAL
ncbi:hypothetical protein E2C01_073525 [Portunus trituberculatus]|uniref:Uncharacterized protein n=1 Tax=Portunus trituberculatus TaxID=210409 RepID=A0A5B7I9Y9_PORTR|nr:hypothetical protein [Portunus trituberculatus]